MTSLTDIDIIKIVAGSSLLGGIFGATITSIVNYFIAQRNFKFKSYEEIVKRRFSAYEKLSNLTLHLRLNISDDDGIIPYAFANGIQQLENFQMIVFEAFPESFWLSDTTSNLFTELNVYLHNINAKIRASKDHEKTLKAIAIHDKDKIKSISRRLDAQLRIDLLGIHEVEKFVNRTASKTKKYSVMSFLDSQK